MLSSREEKDLRALRRRKVRQQEGRFIAEGVRVVEDLLASRVRVDWALVTSSLYDDERGRALIARMDGLGVARRLASADEFSDVATTETPQGVLAVAEIPGWGFRDFLPVAERRVVLLLDAVQDPGNFGTLVRSAEALGAAGVVALPGTVDPWNAKAVRAAAGSSFRMPIVTASWPEAAQWLRCEQFTLLAGAADGESIVRQRGPIALVVGNEGAGVSKEILAEVDRIVGIPLQGRAESLNVAAAAAIILYELTR